MASSLFSFDPFNFHGAQEGYIPFGGFDREPDAKAIQQQQSHFMDTATDWENSNVELLSPSYNFNHQDQYFVEKMFPDFPMAEEVQFGMVSTPFQPFPEPIKLQPLMAETPELVEPRKEKSSAVPLACLELLSSYRAGHKRPAEEKLNEGERYMVRELSTEEVMRMAGARYIQSSVPMGDEFSILKHPFGSLINSLSVEETKEVELAHLLLASAEKIGNHQYDRASRLLTECDYFSSSFGSPVQRIVYYFVDALRDRIERETGRVYMNGVEMEKGRWGEDIEEKMMGPHPALLACHQLLPFSQIMQFTEIQAILDSVASSKRIHLVDLGIRIGIQWTILMQSLSSRLSCPVELVKITAVGTSSEMIAQTGRRLASFAETLNLPFAYKQVVVADMNDLRAQMFEIEAEEKVVVYANLVFGTMIFRQDCLENVMKVIRRLNPCIMTVAEVDGNHNSTSFNTRFIEALFFYSTWFDCFEACMERTDPNRSYLEGYLFSQGIRSVVAAEGRERIIRHVGIDVWRSFFARFGFVEMELSQASLYQASLIVKRFACGSNCTLDMNGNSLIAGWKGTPFHFISAWKFK